MQTGAKGQSLFREEDYDGESLTRLALAGCNPLIEALRTPNMFPIAPDAAKIAESVADLIQDDKDRCVELFFDDNELFAIDIPVSACPLESVAPALH